MAAPREFLMMVRESALGIPVATPVAGTDSIYIRLTDGNSFNVVTEPIMEEIPWGGGLAITGDVVSDHYDVKGALKSKLYPSQAAFLMNWLVTRVNTGQTAPWVTTEPPGDLASVSIFHAIQKSNGTYRKKRYAGVKAAGGRVEFSRQATSASLNIDILGCRSYGNAMDGSVDPTDLEFPTPAETDYPSGPYTFKMTAGGLTLGGTTLVNYENLSIIIQNKLDGRWFENSYKTINRFCGRDSSLEAEILFQATPDRRAVYEAITAQACSVLISNGITGQNMTIQYNGKNRFTNLGYDLALEKVYTEKFTLKNVFSATAGEDISVSFA